MKFHEEGGMNLPLLPGALSPAGHIVVALPDDDSAAALAQALSARGFDSAELRRFSAPAMSRWLKSLLPEAGRAVGYGPLVPGLRDFYILAMDRCSWLVAYAPEDDAARMVSEEARRAGARSVTRYRLSEVAAVAGSGIGNRSLLRDAGADSLAMG